MPGCVRHPDRKTGIRCIRCDRPSCPECLREASVGYQCVDCVRAGSREVPRWRTVAGAAPGTRAVVVLGLIAVNVAVYALTAIQAGSLINNDAAPLFRSWALQTPQVAAGEWWRLGTAGFLHFGPIHLLFNMLALYVIGRDLELILGRGRFLSVYLAGLLGGSAAVFVFGSSGVQVAGASGAVFGLMGGLAVVLRRLRHSLRPAVTLIVVNILISVSIPGISLLGHLGGLVVGTAATAVLVYAPRRRQTFWQAVGIGALIAAVVLVMALHAITLGTAA
ncbi:MAG: rhomboid family intramembrane serine protease [Pseudonocardia sp.]|nr:rhomboid family intramembrane serine protease [Pseudonocardia sp.]